MSGPGASEIGLRDLRVALPFLFVTLVWSSTWIVIKDQLGVVPPIWSVAYRFLIASAAMFLLALIQRGPLNLSRQGHIIAVIIGAPQFALNFNFVYAAEQHVTSGIVAVVFALLVVPNAILAWLVFGIRVTGRFIIGSLVAIGGIGLLFLQELRGADMDPGQVALGIGFTMCGVLCASIANVTQAAERVKAQPIVPLLAWAMLYGTIANAVAAWTFYGPPVVDPRPTYWWGLAYLGVVASAMTFSLYFNVIRAIGPAKAAYSSVLIPILAMAISTIFEGYVWTPLAAAGGALAMIGLVIALTAGRQKPA